MGQPACLKENLVIDPIKSSTKMAPGDFCPYRFPYRNLFPINHVEDELAKDPSP